MLPNHCSGFGKPAAVGSGCTCWMEKLVKDVLSYDIMSKKLMSVLDEVNNEMKVVKKMKMNELNK